MLKAAICEDNPIHAQKTEQLCRELLPAETAIDVFPAYEDLLLKVLQKQDSFYELVLLDIELGSHSGIHLAEEISSRSPETQIIFISQHLKYISPVYEINHTFFIYKPELEQYIRPALTKALQNIQNRNAPFLEFSWNKETFCILQKDIIYMERTMRTTTIHTCTGTYYTAEKLPSLLTRLPDTFALCHRSYLVNLAYTSAFRKDALVLKSGTLLPLSRSLNSDVKSQFLRMYNR